RQPQRWNQVLRGRRDRSGDAADAAAAADANRGVQLLHLVLNLLSRLVPRPPHQQGIGHLSRRAPSSEGTLVAEAEGQRCLHATAPGALWQQRQTEAARKAGTLNPLLDAGRRGIERFT